MADAFDYTTRDSFLEHSQHDEYVEDCSECYLKKIGREFDENNQPEDVLCAHDFEEGICNMCGVEHFIDDYKDIDDDYLP